MLVLDFDIVLRGASSKIVVSHSPQYMHRYRHPMHKKHEYMSELEVRTISPYEGI